ncbi:Uncharacterised protein [Pseudomonas aeruginosa]|nr:Uncharacterised protein [Pseudomonas aeruginosa]VTL99094.1 Uncharacterised protein [Pseudomonas aeruginosa]
MAMANAGQRPTPKSNYYCYERQVIKINNPPDETTSYSTRIKFNQSFIFIKKIYFT